MAQPPLTGPRQHHGLTPPPGTKNGATSPAPAGVNRPAALGVTNPALAMAMGLPSSQQNQNQEFNIPSDIVILPSEGRWYPHGKGQLLQQNMTSSEENILMDEARLQLRTEWNDLLTALIRDPDFLPPGNMLPADFTRCLLNARINSYGSEYEVQVIDPFTGKPLASPNNVVDLSLVKNRPLAHHPDENGTFTYLLPMLKLRVRFRLLTNDEYMTLLRQHAASSTTKVTDRLYAQLVDIEGDTNRNAIAQLARSMPAGDSARLRLFMDEVEPALDPTMDFVSPTTGNPTFQSKISLNDGIFYLQKI